MYLKKTRNLYIFYRFQNHVNLEDELKEHEAYIRDTIEFFQKAKETLNIAEPFSKDNDLIDNMLHDLDQLHKHTEKMQKNVEETKNSQ